MATSTSTGATWGRNVGLVVLGPETFGASGLGGMALGGITGLGWGTIYGGIQKDRRDEQIQADWQSNYNNLQNWFNSGCQGVPGTPSFRGL